MGLGGEGGGRGMAAVLFFSHAVVRTHCINTNQTLLSQEKRKEDYANRLAPRSPSSGANDDESPES